MIDRSCFKAAVQETIEAEASLGDFIVSYERAGKASESDRILAGYALLLLPIERCFGSVDQTVGTGCLVLVIQRHPRTLVVLP
ncbi:hypothetical protein D3C80_428830 [compost metagenome]